MQPPALLMAQIKIKSVLRPVQGVLSLQVDNLEIISAPGPKTLMQASVKQALRRLDNVDPEVKEFFMGAAKTVVEGADPVQALAAALGCMSGFTEVPQDRSLLTQVRNSLELDLFLAAAASLVNWTQLAVCINAGCV